MMVKVVHGLQGVPGEQRGIALGVFDGVHLGHQALIASLIEVCRKIGLRPAALTFSYEGGFGFDRRPLGHEFIMTDEEKLKALGKTGLEEIFLVPLADEFLHLSPAAFLDEVVVGTLGGQVLAIGEDGHFGWRGQGDAAFLESYGAPRGLRSLIVQDVLWEGDKVSSSRIRALLADGRVDQATTMMTRPFSLTGTVVRGRRLGSSIGFPTANFRYPERSVRIRNGVYRTRVKWDGGEYEAVTNVGIAPSVHRDRRETLVESFLYDFDGELYEETITTSFLSFVRPEKRFDSLEELKRQINDDIETVRALGGV